MSNSSFSFLWSVSARVCAQFSLHGYSPLTAASDPHHFLAISVSIGFGVVYLSRGVKWFCGWHGRARREIQIYEKSD